MGENIREHAMISILSFSSQAHRKVNLGEQRSDGPEGK